MTNDRWLGFFVALCGFLHIALGNATAAAIFLVASLAIHRGKL